MLSPEDQDYIRRREAREARRHEVERAAGWSKKPARAWSRTERRKAALTMQRTGWSNAPWRANHMRRLAARRRPKPG